MRNTLRTALFCLTLLALWPLCALAQLPPPPDQSGPYPAKRVDTTFADAFYSTGNIKVLIYYPEDGSGNLVAGPHPVIAFGHGFNMRYDNYNNILAHLASHGYIVISPDVQNGFNTNHFQYGQQLAACIQFLQAEGSRSGSRYQGQVGTTSASFGHSMGGGATMLVPTIWNGITAIAGLAAAETNSTPTAINALTTTTVPALFISGKGDRVTPEADHAQPMYNNASGNKQWLSIVGAGHCRYSDGSTICDPAAAISGENPSVSNATQQLISNTYLTAFFGRYLKNILPYEDYICGSMVASDTRLTSQTNIVCSPQSVSPALAHSPWSLSPNPVAHGVLTIRGAYHVVVYNTAGQQVAVGQAPQGADEFRLSVADLPAGLYFVRASGKTRTLSFLKP